MSKVIAANALIGIAKIMDKNIAENDFAAAKNMVRHSVLMLKAAHLMYGGFSDSTLISAFRIINDPTAEVNKAIGVDAKMSVRRPKKTYDEIDATFDNWVERIMYANRDEKVERLDDAVLQLTFDVNIINANQFKYWRETVEDLAEIAFRGLVYAESCISE